jgi:hypothetical protein
MRAPAWSSPKGPARTKVRVNSVELSQMIYFGFAAFSYLSACKKKPFACNFLTLPAKKSRWPAILWTLPAKKKAVGQQKKAVCLQKKAVWLQKKAVWLQKKAVWLQKTPLDWTERRRRHLVSNLTWGDGCRCCYDPNSDGGEYRALIEARKILHKEKEDVKEEPQEEYLAKDESDDEFDCLLDQDLSGDDGGVIHELEERRRA